MKIGTLLLTLVIAATGAQQSSNRVNAASLNNNLTTGGGIRDVSDQVQNFIHVDGSDLKNKMDTAVQRGRSDAGHTRFWVAYSFDVRSGIAVDANYRSFDGTINNISDTSVMIGTNGGVRVETPNLGVFLLHDR